MTKALVLAFLSLAGVLTVGCGKVRYPQYYTLALAPPLLPAADDARKVGTVAVRKFETPAYLRQGRMCTAKLQTRLDLRVPPMGRGSGRDRHDAVSEALRSSNLFSRVESYEGHDKPDYLLTGRLERLDEIDYGGGVRVEVKLSAQLVNLHTASTVWTGDAAETARVENVP